MNKIVTFLLIFISALSLVLAATVQSKAKDTSYAGLVPFIINTDRLGFLDQNNGRIYIYDNNLNQCLFTGQIKELGKPIMAVSSGNLKTSNPSAL